MAEYPIGPPTFQSGPSSPPPAQRGAEARLLTSADDGRLRYELDKQGRWKAGTAVQQGVALSLGVRRGQIPSAPQVGHELHLVLPGLPSTQAAVEDAVRRSFPLSSYLEQQLVETIEIRHESRPHGGLLVEFVWREPGATRPNTTTFSS